MDQVKHYNERSKTSYALWTTGDECRFLSGLGQWSKVGISIRKKGTPEEFRSHRIALLESYLELMDHRNPAKWGHISPSGVFAYGVDLLERLEAGEDPPLPGDDEE